MAQQKPVLLTPEEAAKEVGRLVNAVATELGAGNVNHDTDTASRLMLVNRLDRIGADLSLLIEVIQRKL